MDRLVQYLRRGLLIILALIAFGGVTVNVASASVASASPALAQVADGVTAQPATDTPNKDQTTEDSLNMIATGVWIFIIALIVFGLGAAVWAYVHRNKSDNNEDDEGEEDEPDEHGEGNEQNKPVA